MVNERKNETKSSVYVPKAKCKWNYKKYLHN